MFVHVLYNGTYGGTSLANDDNMRTTDSSGF